MLIQKRYVQQISFTGNQDKAGGDLDFPKGTVITILFRFNIILI